MLSYREAVLAQLFAERSEWQGTVRNLQEAVAQAVQSQTNGLGAGPSNEDCELLAAAMAASEHADAAYLRMLSRVGGEVIARAQASARARS